jgi:hypothetical protein
MSRGLTLSAGSYLNDKCPIPINCPIPYIHVFETSQGNKFDYMEVGLKKCYTFVSWTDINGRVLSTNEVWNTQFIITKDTILVFNVVKTCPDTLTLTLNRNPTTGGTVSGNGTYPSGTKVPITATPAECYRFVNWTYPNGTQFSTKQRDTVTLTKNDTLIANFEQENNPDVNTIVYPNGLGTIDVIPDPSPPITPPSVPIMATAAPKVTYLVTVDAKDTTYTAYDTADYTVNPNSDAKFVNWTDKYGNVISTDERIKVVVVSDTLIKPNFAREDVEDVIKSGTVSVLVNPDDITVSFEVIKRKRIHIILRNEKEVPFYHSIYYDFIDEGIFTNTLHWKTDGLAITKGDYIVKIRIEIDDKYVVEKIVKVIIE